MKTCIEYTGIEREILIYYGTPIFVLGVLGGIVSSLVFVSLRTFRESSCAFYLTILPMINVGQLFTSVLSRILAAVLGNDEKDKSLFYCKCRYYLFQVCMTVSLTCFCLAIIDQYCATFSRARWQQFCNIKLAKRLVLVSVMFYSAQDIPYFIFYEDVISPSTNETTCTITNVIFAQYRSTLILILVVGYLPVIISTLFGILAFRNFQQIAYLTIALVRRQLDKQLAMMVLVQVIIGIFTFSPYTTLNGIANNVNIVNNSDVSSKLQLALRVTVVISYTYFASGFYISICASERYRRQLIYVLFKIHFRRCIRQNLVVNQITPENKNFEMSHDYRIE